MLIKKKENLPSSLALVLAAIIIASSLVITSNLAIPAAGTTTPAPVTATTDNGSVNVLISWEPSEIVPNQDTQMTLDFQDPSSGESISHVNYNFEIIDENGETVQSMSDLHTHSGSDEQTVTFGNNGRYNLVVTIIGTGIDPPFDTTQSGTAETTIAVGEQLPDTTTTAAAPTGDNATTSTDTPTTSNTTTPSATTTTPGPQMDMGGNMTAMRQGDENQKWGAIASISNDEQGQPAWVIAGYWMIEMAPQNDTATSNTTGSSIGNIADFHAMLHMVRLNGSAMHTHEISNFTQVGDATFDSSTNSTTISGTATITMREGPVPDVQTTIQIAQDNVIAITPDPTPLENHFGDTPIYGIVASSEMKDQMSMMHGGERTGNYSMGT